MLVGRVFLWSGVLGRVFCGVVFLSCDVQFSLSTSALIRASSNPVQFETEVVSDAPAAASIVEGAFRGMVDPFRCRNIHFRNTRDGLPACRRWDLDRRSVMLSVHIECLSALGEAVTMTPKIRSFRGVAFSGIPSRLEVILG